MKPYKEVEVPPSPYTGGEENSSFGLFIRMKSPVDENLHRFEGDRCASFVLAINDTILGKEAAEVKKSLQEYAEAGADIKVMWRTAIKTDTAELEEYTVIQGIMFEVAFVVDGKVDPPIFSLASVVPVSVARAWMREIVDKKITSIEAIFILSDDAIHGKTSLGKTRINNELIRHAGYSDESKDFAWVIGKDDMVKMVNDLEAIENHKVEDEYYGDIDMGDEPLYLFNYAGKE